jgi:hypothetical protein
VDPILRAILAQEVVGVGDTGAPNHDLPPERAEEKVVLVLSAYLAGVSDPVGVDLALAGPALAGWRSACGAGVGGGHLELLSGGAYSALWDGRPGRATVVTPITSPRPAAR